MAAWLAAKPATEAGLPWILCSAPGDPAAAARPRTAVKTLRSEALVTHVFFENPSPTEAADVLAITVHEEGAALTTFLD
jgi:hypothetical protein